MGDLTKNLSRHEFNSSDGERIAVDFEMVEWIQKCCDYFSSVTGRDIGVQITSGYRSPSVNARTENAANKSMHLFGMAADFRLYFKDNKKRIKPSLIYAYLDKKNPNRFGVSLYSNRVHFDVRQIKWRDSKVKP